MGFRNGTVRQLKVPELSTTVLTLTITAIAADSRLAGGSGENMGRRLAAISMLLLGAAIGATLVIGFGLALPLLITGFTVCIGTLLFARHPAAARPHGK